jgi:hypothetical protein
LRMPASIPDLADWRARASSFEQLAGFTLGSATLSGVEVPAACDRDRLTANLPDVWGLTPILGRAFRDEDGHPARRESFCSPSDSGSSSSRRMRECSDRACCSTGAAHDRRRASCRAQSGFFKDAEVFTPLVLRSVAQRS